MARYKPIDRTPPLLPVVLSEQIQPGTRASISCQGMREANTASGWRRSIM